MPTNHFDGNFEELAQRLIRSEAEGFRQFAEVFGPRLRRLFLNRGMPRTEAEDLAVTCVTDIALKAKDGYSRADNFAAWVFKLARRAAADWWRKYSRGHSLPAIDLSVQSDERTETESDMNIFEAVQNALASLSPKDEEVVRLRFECESSTFAEIGTRIGTTEEAARVRFHRAMKSLREILEHDARTEHLRRQNPAILGVDHE